MKCSFLVTASLAMASTALALPSGKRDTEGRSSDVWTDLNSKIKYVIYLMMENHSFDNIAGYWDFNPAINGLKHIKFCNNYTNPNWTVWNEPISICASPYEQEVPLKDPDHNFAGTSFEIYENWNPSNADTPTMGGFVDRQSYDYNATPGNSAFVIKAYDQKKTQVLATMAENFAFWDSYHAEHPGPTDPNRQFATSGSTCGYVDNTNQSAGFFINSTGVSCVTSIFESLTKANISWKNYYETEITDAYMYKWVQENAMSQIVHSSEFYSDLANGTLPRFSYYNPECCTVDSMHPLSNAAAGQQLIKHLYDAVRNSKYWEESLIIINFDEHGGFADHVPPPVNIPAPEDGIKFKGMSDKHNVTYDFTRLGVRVPAFIISPWIPAGTLISKQGTMYAPNSAYTHSSFLHFLQNLWKLEGLNNRVQWAKTFEYVFSDTMRKDCLKTLPVPEWIGGSTQTQPQAFYLLNQGKDYYAKLP